MATVTFITGLCGSGKTWLKERLVADRKFDEGFILETQQQQALISALISGENCVVVEISFCLKTARDNIVAALLANVPGLHINWICFENAPSKANRNCLARVGHAGDPEKQIEINSRLSRDYSYPDGAAILKIWTKE